MMLNYLNSVSFLLIADRDFIHTHTHLVTQLWITVCKNSRQELSHHSSGTGERVTSLVPITVMTFM